MACQKIFFLQTLAFNVITFNFATSNFNHGNFKGFKAEHISFRGEQSDCEYHFHGKLDDAKAT